jgi:hypothetical protein
LVFSFLFWYFQLFLVYLETDFKPFASHLTDIQLALQDLLELTSTAKTRNEVNGVLAYLKRFVCVLMFVVWYKELTAIDICNKMIQARDATLEIKLCHGGGGVGRKRTMVHDDTRTHNANLE